MTLVLLRKTSSMKRIEKNIGQYMKSKQLLFIENLICLALLSVNLVYKFSEIYLSYNLSFILQINSSYFSKMVISVKWL